MTCQQELRKQKKPYPRTCADCGLGPCKLTGFPSISPECAWPFPAPQDPAPERCECDRSVGVVCEPHGGVE